ncbi:MAG: NADH-quinone oxidoreductase subunit J [Alphaproteobacteria bacterium]
MSVPDFLFYLFSGVLLISALLVISARNPVHAVLFLILAFFNSAGLFLLIGAEFIAMMIVVVYVGAVMVLFLFVVMMLDVNFISLQQGMAKNLVAAIAVGAILFIELAITLSSWSLDALSGARALAPIPDPMEIDNTRALGQVLYTEYVYLFQGSGLILLVAMIGAIVLTLRTRDGVKRQVIRHQLERRSADEITLHSGK